MIHDDMAPLDARETYWQHLVEWLDDYMQYENLIDATTPDGVPSALMCDTGDLDASQITPETIQRFLVISREIDAYGEYTDRLAVEQVATLAELEAHLPGWLVDGGAWGLQEVIDLATGHDVGWQTTVKITSPLA